MGQDSIYIRSTVSAAGAGKFAPFTGVSYVPTPVQFAPATSLNPHTDYPCAFPGRKFRNHGVKFTMSFG